MIPTNAFSTEYCQKFIQVCDPHVTGVTPRSRRDNYFSTICNKLAEAVSIANDLGASLIIAGDLVHTYDAAPRIINTITKILREARKPVYMVLGNHDVYGHNAAAAADNVIIGNLIVSGVVRLLSTSPILVEENGVRVQLTGVSYHTDMDKDATDYFISKPAGVDKAIHVLHSYLVDRPWPRHEGYTLISDVVTQADIIMTGHEHLGFGIIVREDGVIFSNIGALGRVNAAMSEMNRLPHLALFKCFADRVEHSLIRLQSVRPSTEVLDRSVIEAEEARARILDQFDTQTTVRIQTADLPRLITHLARVEGVEHDVIELTRELITIAQQRLAQR